jgi:hypothetical protein
MDAMPICFLFKQRGINRVLAPLSAQVKVLLQMEAAGRIDLWRSVLTLHKQKQRVGLAQGPSRENYTVGLKVKHLSVPGLSVPAPTLGETPCLTAVPVSAAPVPCRGAADKLT